MRTRAIWRSCARRSGLALGISLLLFSGGARAAEPPIGIDVSQVSPYFAVGTTEVNGEILGKVVINGPPEPPGRYRPTTMALPLPSEDGAVNAVFDVPAFNWSFGCSATSAAMIAGYYDRAGYWNMYAGPTNGGVMPLNNSAWSDWIDGCDATRHRCPLSATQNGLDGRTTNGHVDDYWVCYGDEGPDPFVDDPDDPSDPYWTEHTLGDCTADFMRTNQASDPYYNEDGATSFYYYTGGAKYAGMDPDDGGYGFELFCESRGYTVVDRYNRVLLGYDWDGEGTEYEPATQGATFADYKAEIDAGRPVMIHVVGHTMVGIGYNDATSPETIYIHNTWDYNVHTMLWGGTYTAGSFSGLHLGITVLTLAEPEIDVRGQTVSIPDGDSSPSEADDTDFGDVEPGAAVSHTFTIHNVGDETLQLTGTPTVQVLGPHTADFTVSSQPASTSIPPSGSTTFTVEFAPSVTGLRMASITIPNTDLTENPYDFTIQGTGRAPSPTAAVFRVTAEGAMLADGTVYADAFETVAGDVAEWVPVSEAVTVGSVVELDPANPGAYRLSSGACSMSVGGVISTEPGLVLGRSTMAEKRALLALVGIVPTWVTDEGGSIEPGDLLVTSSTPGHAMRWDDPGPCPCALVGKALEPMTDGRGVIRVLLTAH